MIMYIRHYKISSSFLAFIIADELDRKSTEFVRSFEQFWKTKQIDFGVIFALLIFLMRLIFFNVSHLLDHQALRPVYCAFFRLIPDGSSPKIIIVSSSNGMRYLIESIVQISQKKKGNTDSSDLYAFEQYNKRIDCTFCSRICANNYPVKGLYYYNRKAISVDLMHV